MPRHVDDRRSEGFVRRATAPGCRVVVRSERVVAQGEKGFTLIEMLVVISILAVLTTIAVQSLGPVEEKARHEATGRTLNQVRDAVVTTNDSAVAGFIADTGRVPTSIADLSGLVSPTAGIVLQPTDLPAYGVLNVQAGPDWNGTSWEITPGTTGSYFSLNQGWHGPWPSVRRASRSEPGGSREGCRRKS
jgi:prepilin-type N-terminal cleavage/methylation domain-containing protein